MLVHKNFERREGKEGEKYGIGHHQTQLESYKKGIQELAVFNFLESYQSLSKQVFNWLAPFKFYSWRCSLGWDGARKTPRTPEIINAVTI